MRRTPKLTAEARRLFLQEFEEMGRPPVADGTIEQIAETLDLTAEQVRDSIFSESAEPWRREAVEHLRSLGFVDTRST